MTGRSLAAVIRTYRRIALALCVISISACGTWVFPSELRLEPEVVRELRGVGTVLAEEEWKDTWGDVDIFGRIFIVDGGELGIPAAVQDLTERLTKLDWKVVNKSYGQIGLMAERWDDVKVVVASADAFIYDDVENARVALAIENVTKRSASDSLVILSVRPLDG
jgi:hypothetical protein